MLNLEVHDLLHGVECVRFIWLGQLLQARAHVLTTLARSDISDVAASYAVSASNDSTYKLAVVELQMDYDRTQLLKSSGGPYGCSARLQSKSRMPGLHADQVNDACSHAWQVTRRRLNQCKRCMLRQAEMRQTQLCIGSICSDSQCQPARCH